MLGDFGAVAKFDVAEVQPGRQPVEVAELESHRVQQAVDEPDHAFQVLVELEPQPAAQELHFVENEPREVLVVPVAGDIERQRGVGELDPFEANLTAFDGQQGEIDPSASDLAPIEGDPAVDVPCGAIKVAASELGPDEFGVTLDTGAREGSPARGEVRPMTAEPCERSAFERGQLTGEVSPVGGRSRRSRTRPR